MLARILILPRGSKQIYSGSWVLAFLSYLSSPWQVPNALSQDHFYKVENPGRSVPTVTSQVECPRRKAEYRWSKVIFTWASPDDLNFAPVTLFTIYRNEDSEV